MQSEKQNLERRSVARVLISVSDKSAIDAFSRSLVKNGIEIVSTGGTSKILSENGIAVTSVEDVTKFPEMMDGRVKTLHPLIFGGILARDSDKSETEQYNIGIIDMVVCNLYPFGDAASKGVDMDALIEEIDIGGPSLLRAAAKNHARVAVVTDPADYDWISKEIEAGGLNLEQRRQLALKAFRHTAEYDTIIQNELSSRFDEKDLPPSLHIAGVGSPPLRYGENPHQSAIFYSDTSVQGPCVSNSTQIQGKQLSYNNLLDFDAVGVLIIGVMVGDDDKLILVPNGNPQLIQHFSSPPGPRGIVHHRHIDGAGDDVARFDRVQPCGLGDNLFRKCHGLRRGLRLAHIQITFAFLSAANLTSS